MSLRLSSAVALSAALAISFFALVRWRPSAVLPALAFALTGAGVARLLSRGATGGTGHDGGASPEHGTTQTARRAKSATGAAGEIVPAGELVETMMDSMREGMLVVDADLNVVASNAAARILFGFGRGGTAARGRLPRLNELTRNPAVLSAYLEAIERGERVEVKVAMEDAERRVFDLRVAPLRQRRGAGLPGVAAGGA
ncbi:MAG TPA: PAS domain-containing protein, partial [Pyrinomonadaceae bacterium]